MRLEHFGAPTALLLEIARSHAQVRVEAKESTLELAVHWTKQDLPQLLEARMTCLFRPRAGRLSFGLPVAGAFVRWWRRGRRQWPRGRFTLCRLVLVFRHVPTRHAESVHGTCQPGSQA